MLVNCVPGRSNYAEADILSLLPFGTAWILYEEHNAQRKLSSSD